MSSPPRRDDSTPSRPPVTLMKLAEKRALGEPIVMVTAYDHPSALAVEAAEVDIVLVGDSAANNVLGYADTVPVTVDELLMLAAAVRRGLKTPLLVGDLPFGSYEASDAQAIASAHRFVKEAGCDAVKLEGGGAMADRARAIVRAGVPVMGHVGLTPQTATALGGYRAQGRTAERARAVLDDALALQDAGCFSIVFEAIPAEVTDVIMEHMQVPVIGIGAGPSTDGQVLVLHDLLAIHIGFKPKFVNLFEEAGSNIVRAAELLERMLEQWPDHGELARDVVVCEEEGDRITHDIIQRLNSTFVTPIDREDIYALASSLDDIVDFVEEVSDFLGLYRIEAPMEQAQQMARILHEAARQLHGAMPRLRSFDDIRHFTIEVNRLEN